jgi:hypothetical protein
VRTRTILNYAARIAVVLALLWLARNVYRALSVALAVEVARIGPIDLATNVSVVAPVWIAGVIANVIVATRIRSDAKRPFRRALITISLLSIVLVIGSMASMALLPKFAFVVLLSSGASVLPLQAVLLAVGVMLLTSRPVSP